MTQPEVFYTSHLATDANPILRCVHGRRLATDLALVRCHGGPDRRFLDFDVQRRLRTRGRARRPHAAIRCLRHCRHLRCWSTFGRDGRRDLRHGAESYPIDATIIVEVPIESGPILLVKNTGSHVLHRGTRKRYKRYRLGAKKLVTRLRFADGITRSTATAERTGGRRSVTRTSAFGT